MSSNENNQGLTYLLQGIETFKAFNGRVDCDTVPEGCITEHDMRRPKELVSLNGITFREHPLVMVYDSNLADDARRIEIARNLIRLAPEYSSVFGRKLGNASSRGSVVRLLAHQVSQNGGRAVVDNFLSEHTPISVQRDGEIDIKAAFDAYIRAELAKRDAPRERFDDFLARYTRHSL